eukprot:GHVU01179483.1.p3 GENE.GHVU01179483.1~~GHVU01179483.1.p3  ORF type:complete len:104 (+),score=14.99 GHVU01179483.1:308-619(+)
MTTDNSDDYSTSTPTVHANDMTDASDSDRDCEPETIGDPFGILDALRKAQKYPPPHVLHAQLCDVRDKILELESNPGAHLECSGYAFVTFKDQAVSKGCLFEE